MLHSYKLFVVLLVCFILSLMHLQSFCEEKLLSTKKYNINSLTYWYKEITLRLAQSLHSDTHAYVYTKVPAIHTNLRSHLQTNLGTTQKFSSECLCAYGIPVFVWMYARIRCVNVWASKCIAWMGTMGYFTDSFKKLNFLSLKKTLSSFLRNLVVGVGFLNK